MNLVTARLLFALLLAIALPARAASLIVDTATVEKAIAAEMRGAMDNAEFIERVKSGVRASETAAVLRDLGAEVARLRGAKR